MSIADVDFGVTRTDQTWRARTNANGDYIVAVPQAGTHVVTATKEGVGSDRITVAVRRSGLITANLTLFKTPAATVARIDCGTNSSSSAFKQNPLAAGAPVGLARLVVWLEAVHLHTAGCTRRARTRSRQLVVARSRDTAS